MGNDPAFLFYPGDYLRDTQCLSEKTQVAYDRIMCEHMRNICISKTRLKFFTKRLSPEEVGELESILEETEKGFQIPWVALSIEKRKAYSDSRRENRKGKSKEISKSYDSHMENEIEIENKDKKAIKKEKKIKHSFDKSPYFDKKAFQESLGVDIHETAFWWEELNAYSIQGNKYLSWITTAQTWKRKAESEGKTNHKTYRIPTKKIPIKQIVDIQEPEEEMGPPDGFEMPEILAKKVPKNDESVFEKKKRFLKQGG